jgi:hypothetical protein
MAAIRAVAAHSNQGRVLVASLRDIILYICMGYPYPKELSKARLTKMVYLADWRSAITQGKTLTNIQWHYNHYGPSVDDVVEAARNDPGLLVKKTSNALAPEKEVISALPEAELGPLSEQETAVLDHVIRETAPLHWTEFVKMVYSTYPVLTGRRYETLDLVQLAEEYETVKKEMIDPLLDST